MRHETPERQAADFVQFKNGVYQIHPILDWSHEAALNYLAEHDLPINEDHWDPTKGRDQRGECLIGDNCGIGSGPNGTDLSAAARWPCSEQIDSTKEWRAGRPGW